MARMNASSGQLAPPAANIDEECSRIATPIGSGFRYACVPLKDADRRAITALRAIDLTLAEITSTQAESQVARHKLEWWRQALHQALALNQAEHPLLQALCACTEESARKGLIPLIELRLGAAVIELDYQGFETQQDLFAYLDGAGGTMHEAYARILRIPDMQQAPLRSIGALHHRLQRLTYLGRHSRQGQIYLSAEQLEKAGVTEADFHRPNAAVHLAPLLQNELADLEKNYQDAIHELRAITRRPPAFFRALIALDRAQIDLLHRLRADVLTSRPETTPFQRLITAWWSSKRPLPLFPKSKE